MKASDRYFPVVLFITITPCNVVLTFESVQGILKHHHSKVLETDHSWGRDLALLGIKMFIKSIEFPLLRLRQCHSSLFAFFFLLLQLMQIMMLVGFITTVKYLTSLICIDNLFVHNNCTNRRRFVITSIHRYQNKLNNIRALTYIFYLCNTSLPWKWKK